MCEECRASGKTVRRAKGHVRYTATLQSKECNACGARKALNEFRKLAGKHVASCTRCETVQCAVCKESKSSLEFPLSSRYNHFTHGRQQVACSACLHLGRSVHQPQLYLCSGPCGLELGAARFDRCALTTVRRSGGRLTCAECTVEGHRREKKLNKTIAGSKAVCRCKPPWTRIHRDACPFHPLNVRHRYMWDDKLPGPQGKVDSEWLLQRKRDKQL